MQFNINLLVKFVGGLRLEGAITRALEQSQDQLTNLNCVFGCA